ncbi:MAG: ShlB/FhaC/HecB family hemolysin secretion/activation protein, partial [Candidatus Omnitrophica bacterium]|nr:ShlB/FhaC/HecB family hemolysin secretion/activation protein [Candidatus Omnitrophota bacterium]MDD5489038.1 ShlB/FhaC/HecB family hemolysin secretion/activation protein [Candidatus Omnitrophota bacterium]
RDFQQRRAQDAMTKALKTKKTEPDIKEESGVIPEAPAGPAKEEGPKVFIEKIEVEGVTVFRPAFIQKLVKPYEGTEMSLAGFQAVADKITDEYRKRGYVTSVAYLLPQRIENQTLRIAVSEGKVGEITVTGNRYFKASSLLRYLDQRKGDLFNYDTLRENVQYINEHPDRNASTVLAKGAGPGETDINMEVRDKLPLHATLGYNNYNSRFLEKNKYSTELKATNFLGMGHIVSGEMQLGEAGRFSLYSARYLLPIDEKSQIGASYIHLYQELAGNVGDLEITGRGDIVSLYYSYKLINTDNFTMSVVPGFEYKEIQNKLLGIIVSQDLMRIGKLGLDFDISDPWGGRNIITQTFNFGIKDIFGGLGKNDPRASRAASKAGGQFFSSVTNFARIQDLPWDLSYMMRGSMQLTGDALTSSEQFNIGGFSTVRGYPVAEYAGDRGFQMSHELYVPPYGVPKDWRIPFTRETVYDSLRGLIFFDWGKVENKNPAVGELSQETIYSFGPGLRFDIPGKLSVSFDYGFGLGQKGSDGAKSRAYIEVKMFL